MELLMLNEMSEISFVEIKYFFMNNDQHKIGIVVKLMLKVFVGGRTEAISRVKIR